MAAPEITPELIAQVRAALANDPTGQGRSPMKSRQLNDLRLLPTATDPRPFFSWSAESPRDAVPVPPPYARLMWNDDGTEITVHSEHERAQKAREGWRESPPALEPETDADRARAEFESLSPEDQAIVRAAQEDARRQRLAELGAQLADVDLPKRRGRPRKA